MLLTECGKEVAKGSLVAHRQTQHGVEKGRLGQGNVPITYRMVFPANPGPMPCLVKGCSGRAATRTAMRVYLWYWHVRDTVVII